MLQQIWLDCCFFYLCLPSVFFKTYCDTLFRTRKCLWVVFMDQMHTRMQAHRYTLGFYPHNASCHHVRPPVRPSVHLSQVGVLLNWLNIGPHKQCHKIAQGLYFSDAENLGTTQTGSPPTEAPVVVVVGASSSSSSIVGSDIYGILCSSHCQ